MRNWFLAAGVAALAIAAPAAADKGGNKGQGGQQASDQRGGGQAAKADRGGRGQTARVERGGGQAKRAERGGRDGGQAMRAERGGRGQAARVERSGGIRFAQAQRDRPEKSRSDGNRGRAAEARQLRVDKPKRDMRGQGRGQQQAIVDRGRDKQADRAFADRGRKSEIVRIDDGNVRVRDYNRIQSRFADTRVLGLINGCPPGLDKKNNGCLPPGQAKKQMIGSVIPASLRSSLLPLQLRDYWRDDDDHYYRYNDGYLYEVDRDTNLIASLLPLFGGGYSLGQTFPYQSSAYMMPSYYQPFYQDTADMYYRYNDGYVYGVDPYSGMVENIIPTYDYGYGVGQMLPASYSYYNLPYPYRTHYTDNDDYYYRYAPGAIYQVDRDTQLISAMVSLLTGTPNSLAVGQPLPLGYDAYNVPFAYRDEYFDSPDNWYRYNNGHIYQVDPTTRLITAVIDAIV